MTSKGALSITGEGPLAWFSIILKYNEARRWKG